MCVAVQVYGFINTSSPFLIKETEETEDLKKKSKTLIFLRSCASFSHHYDYILLGFFLSLLSFAPHHLTSLFEGLR